MNRLFVSALALVFAAMLLGGCSSAESGPVSETTASVGPPAAPAAFIQATPQDAVRSYLDGITFAYRVANSDVASSTMTAWEYVRVDSYIEKNRQEGRGIEQTLTAFDVTGIVGEEPTVTVSTTEDWGYRYFALADGAYRSEELTAAYSATYTVVREGELWKVDSVKVVPKGEVK